MATDPDRLAGYLADAQGRAEHERRWICAAPEGPAWSCEDVPILVAAVEAALKLADDWAAVGPPPRPAEEIARRACAARLVKDITHALLGEES